MVRPFFATRSGTLGAMTTPDQAGEAPLRIALIGGSGLGEAFSATAGQMKVHDELDTPFGRPSGPIVQTRFEGVDVLLLQRHGPGHLLNPSQVPYRANLFALKMLGATHVLASGAVGSLRAEYEPRHLVIVDQAIDKTIGRANTFYERAAVHVDFAEPFCPVLRSLLADAADSIGVRTHPGGCYVCAEGPQFSSRAESHLHRLFGGDVVGMTLLPEAKLAREAELPYAALCLVTDYDVWRPHDPSVARDADALLSEIIGHLKEASANAMAVLRAAITAMPRRREDLATCPASSALRLGIWSDKTTIDPREIERLSPLWGRYFPAADEPAK